MIILVTRMIRMIILMLRMMAHGSWLMAQGSWLMAKRGRPDPGAQGDGGARPDRPPPWAPGPGRPPLAMSHEP